MHAVLKGCSADYIMNGSNQGGRITTRHATTTRVAGCWPRPGPTRKATRPDPRADPIRAADRAALQTAIDEAAFAAVPEAEVAAARTRLAELVAAEAAAKRARRESVGLGGVQLPEDRAYVADLQARIAEQGRQNDVEFLPNIDRQDKVAFLQTLSVLSVPARYNESFGLYLLEAMAAGVPVVQPRHAAFPEILEATSGGLLCEPDSASSLADALFEALTNDTLAQELGEQARRSIKSKFTAEHMAQRVATICEKLAAPGAAKAPRNIAH